MGIHERKEREKEQRKEEILNAAQKVFFEKGLQAATMDEVAEMAELSKGTLYLYYKSKEDIYLAVMVRGMRVVYEMFEPIVFSHEPTVVKLAKMTEAYYEFFQKHRQYFRMFYFYQNPQFHKQVSDEMMQCCTEENQRVWNLVVRVIQQGIDEGDLRSDINPMVMGVIVWSSANAIMTRMDTQMEYFHATMGVRLDDVLKTSNALLLESFMTEKAKQQYGALIHVGQKAGGVAVN
jgi:AcrR family transcriptional regulator